MIFELRFFAYPNTNLDDLFRVPHCMLVFAVFTSLALLAVQFKHDIAHIGGIVQLEPKDDPALHRRPSVATLLKSKNDRPITSLIDRHEWHRKVYRYSTEEGQSSTVSAYRF